MSEARLLAAISEQHHDRRFRARLLAHGGELDSARRAVVHFDPAAGRVLVTAGGTFWAAAAVTPALAAEFAIEIARRLARSGRFTYVPFGFAPPTLRAAFPDIFPAASCG